MPDILDSVQTGPPPVPRTLKEKIMSLLSEDISGKYDVRWYPINGDDHDSWVRPGKDTKTYQEAFSYVADSILETIERHETQRT